MPQPTIREQIISAVQQVLTAINGQSPYQTEVDQVYAHDISPVDSIADDVSLGVFSRTYQVSATKTRLTHGIDADAVLILGIRAVIRANPSNADQEKSQLIADVQRALFSNISLGLNPNNNAVCVKGITIDQENVSLSGTGALATFLASVHVGFLTDPSNP